MCNSLTKVFVKRTIYISAVTLRFTRPYPLCSVLPNSSFRLGVPNLTSKYTNQKDKEVF